MGRQCITSKEYDSIISELHKETNIITDSIRTIKDNDSDVEKYFYYIEFELYEGFVVFIGNIHKQYGSDIDIRVMVNTNTVVVYIRGLGKEMK